jgi:hypothetical protein
LTGSGNERIRRGIAKPSRSSWIRAAFRVYQDYCVFNGIPKTAEQWGFVIDTIGVHSSRTMMLAELRLLLAACPPTANFDQYRDAVLSRNVLRKDTVSTRRESVRRLRELYALNPAVLLFRALRDLWSDAEQAQPLMTLSCALARDPVLRRTAEFVLTLPSGESVTPQALATVAVQNYPRDLSATTRATIGRNIASSWRQAGHLVGHVKKQRGQAVSQPAAVAYALLLGYMCGSRGDGLFQSGWARVLDAPEYTLRTQATIAAQRGYLEYRHAGSVTDVSFRYLLRDIKLPAGV